MSNAAAMKDSDQQLSSAVGILIQKAAHCAEKEQWDMVQSLLVPNTKLIEQTADGCYLMGCMCFNTGRQKEGLHWSKKALSISPKHPGALYSLGAEYLKLEDFQQATQCLNQFIKLKPDHAKAMLYLGYALDKLDRMELALSVLKQAEAIEPNLKDLALYIARTQLNLGNVEEAKTYIEKALQEDPSNGSAIYNYALIHKSNFSPERLKQFREVFEDQPDNRDLKDVGYALANYFETHKDYECAFDYYERTNALCAAKQDYKPEVDLCHLPLIQHALGILEKMDLQHYGCKEKGPVFIVGMPRSGSTLTEQILSAHSEVTAAGELSLMRTIARDTLKKVNGESYPLNIEKLSPVMSEKLGEMYLKALRSYGDTPYVIDKMPSNYYYAPLIKMILPNAKIICMDRDPIDTCWSLWRQNFRFGHHYRHDLKHLGHYCGMHEKVRELYKNFFGDWMYFLRYEDLTNEPEEQMRGLIAYCGLEWEEGVLEYHKQKQKIRTASINQANKAIYTSSQRSWEPIKHRLTPLINALHESGVETCISKGEVVL